MQSTHQNIISTKCLHCVWLVYVLQTWQRMILPWNVVSSSTIGITDVDDNLNQNFWAQNFNLGRLVTAHEPSKFIPCQTSYRYISDNKNLLMRDNFSCEFLTHKVYTENEMAV